MWWNGKERRNAARGLLEEPKLRSCCLRVATRPHLAHHAPVPLKNAHRTTTELSRHNHHDELPPRTLSHLPTFLLSRRLELSLQTDLRRVPNLHHIRLLPYSQLHHCPHLIALISPPLMLEHPQSREHARPNDERNDSEIQQSFLRWREDKDRELARASKDEVV